MNPRARNSSRWRSPRWWSPRITYPTRQAEGLSHGSGQVFDIDYSGLPPAELECLRFVLNDLGWDGYLGFVEEGRDNLHIGCSPTSRDFFTSVFKGVGNAR